MIRERLIEFALLIMNTVNEVSLLYLMVILVVAEVLLVSKYRFDILVYCCFIFFLLSQFQHPILIIGRWVVLFIISAISALATGMKKIRITPVVVGLGLISFYAILTSPFSFYPSISTLKGFSLLLITLFLAFITPIIQKLYPKIGANNYILRMYLVFSIVVVLSNAVYTVLLPSQAFLANRFRGWFLNPNGIGAMYGVFFIPTLANAYRKRAGGLGKIVTLAILLVAIIEWLASQSRAGIIAGFTALGILMLGTPKFQVRIVLILAAVFLSGAIIAVNPTDNVFRWFLYRNETTLMGSGRLPVWILTWNRFLQHPMWGSGLGVSDTQLLPTGITFSTGDFTIEKGNSYLGVLEELGIAGSLIFFLNLLVPLIYSCWRMYDFPTSPDRETKQVLIAIVVSGLVNAIFEAWILSVGSILCFSFWLSANLLFSSD